MSSNSRRLKKKAAALAIANAGPLFFLFSQNNSGGSFRCDDKRGIGPRVWIEARNAEHACERAEGLGIYFDGCDDGQDCPCCGDRWYRARDNEGKDVCELSEEYDFNSWNTVYLHRADGSIERITREECSNLQPHLRLAA